jgi:hypothetical protein
MTIEVTCGQCHGRLLVETPGGVVACPHCGVHLAIPLPEPEPTTHPEPIVEQDTAIGTAPPASEVPPTADDPGDIELNFGTAAPLAPAPDEVPVDPFASVFGESDDHDQATELGWNSAPNLYVAPSDPPHTSSPSGTEPSPALSTSPPMDHRPDPSPVSAKDSAMALFPSFGEAPRLTDPVWNLTPGEAATSVADDQFLTASQPLTVGIPTDEVTDVSDRLMFSFQDSLGVVVSPAVFPPESATARTIAPLGESTENLAISSSQQISLGAVAATLAAADGDGTRTIHLSESSSDATTLDSPTVSETAAAYAAEAVASRQKFFMLLLLVVGSYASAITIVLIYVLTMTRTHQLESLPDLAPPMQKGVIGWLSIQPKYDVPTSHVLMLGQSQRFGNVRVTPTKVTRGPLAFRHYTGDKTMVRSPTQPLLKLWLKFENVSSNQAFAPLDRVLVFKRKYNGGLNGQVFSYGFLGPQQARASGDSLFRVYDMPVESEYQLVGAAFDRVLGPGESCEQFVPSEEEASELKGDLVWRVHFRKGYHPKSLHGVTTLIDVQFHSQDISNESEPT